MGGGPEGLRELLRPHLRLPSRRFLVVHWASERVISDQTEVIKLLTWVDGTRSGSMR